METMASRPSSSTHAFASALKRARHARGLTQEDFANVSGRTYVSALERGIKSPTFDKIADLAEALELHPLTLLTLAYLNARRGESVERLQTQVRRELKELTHDDA